MTKDKKTVKYFDKMVPEYGVRRLKRTAEIINRYSGEGSSLADIGCGTGSALDFIKRNTNIKKLCGIDVSKKSLTKTLQKVDCETFVGSVLDSDLPAKIGKRYDFALLSSILHHLIGGTRRSSMRHAVAAVSNSLKLLKEGGHLIIEEPIYSTSFAMTVLFYLKKGVTKITSNRVFFGGKTNNIGAPVVSFYTNEQLVEMMRGIEGCEIIDVDFVMGRLKSFWRYLFIAKNGNMTITLKKTG